MEESTSDDARWEQIMSAQGEPADNLVLLPKLRNRDLTPREASEKTVRFAEALAFEDTWVGINQARVKQQQRKAA